MTRLITGLKVHRNAPELNKLKMIAKESEQQCSSGSSTVTSFT